MINIVTGIRYPWSLVALHNGSCYTVLSDRYEWPRLFDALADARKNNRAQEIFLK